MIQFEARGGKAQAQHQNMKNLQPCLCEDRGTCVNQNYGLSNKTEHRRFLKQHRSYYIHTYTQKHNFAKQVVLYVQINFK